MPDYFDLGSYMRPVTTSSAQARTWFTRGLLWAYAFNHEEAVTCFEHAIRADPECELAYWGLAYALGPNYNKPWEAFGRARGGLGRVAGLRRRRGGGASRWPRHTGGTCARSGPSLAVSVRPAR